MLTNSSLKTYLLLKDAARRLNTDESGATMIEYSVLIGLLTIAVITLITTVGTDIVADWTTLEGAL